MAYTKAPQVSTYDTKRVSFVANPQQRSGSLPGKDFRMVNMLTEMVPSPVSQEKKYFVRSRPGLFSTYTVASGTARGLYTWKYSGTSYAMSVIGNKVYANATEVLTLTTSTGLCGFTEYLNLAGTVSLVLLDGSKGYVFSNPTTPVEITDADFPTPHIPTPVFLDGYLFVVKAGTSDIYNSNLNDPMLWTAGDFISSEIYPDILVGIGKNNNYLYGIGSSSIEYFYDAANATGTPLARHATAVQQFGCSAIGTLAQTEKEVIFVGETGNGEHTVWTIDGFKEKEISIPMVRAAFREEGASLPNAVAYCVRVASQKLYVIRLTTRTLVYSFDTQMWHEWASGVTNNTAFLGKFGSDGSNGTVFMLDAAGGTVYTMSDTYTTDAGTAILREIVTSKLDFEMMNRKFISRLTLVGDVPDDTGVNNSVQVSWSDDDYKTWSTARNLTLGSDFPSLTQLGSFRRRAFRFQYSLPHFLRLEGFEVDLNKGNQ